MKCSFLRIGSLDINILTLCDIVLEESEFLPEVTKLCKTSKMELFAKLVNGCSFILDVWQGSESTPVFY